MSEGLDRRAPGFIEHVYKNAAIGLCYFDAELRYQHVNEWLAALNGVPVEAHLGRTIYEVVPGVAERVGEHLRHVLETGAQIVHATTEAEIPSHPGMTRAFSHNYQPVKAEDGTVVGVACFVQEVTEQKRAQEEHSRWAHIFEHTDVALVISKPDGAIDLLNPAACRMYQATPDMLKHLRDIYAPEALDDLLDHARKVNEEGHDSFESKHRRSDGTVFPVQVAVTAVRGADESIDYLIATVEDISDRKEAEKQAAMAGWVVDAVADGLIVIDQLGRIRSMNPAAGSIFGYDGKDLEGGNISALMPEPHRGGHDQSLANFLETGEAKIIGIGREVEGRCSDGSTFPMDLRVSEFRLDGEPMYAGVVRDITERNRLMAQVVQAQKLDSVGQLAGGIAHDFNNQLAVMLLDVDGILDREAEGADALARMRDDLKRIRKGIQRSSALTKKLLLFSQNAARKMERLDVNGQIDELEKMLSRLLGEHINAVVDLDEDLWGIVGDVVSIDQIVTNLAINSRDAMPEGGLLVIATSNVVVDSEVASVHPQARAGRFVCITVRDTGCGMDERVRAQMFDPFFSTKNPNENTGLGLSVVYGAVTAHEGWIQSESALGKGTRIDVYLPALADRAVQFAVPDIASTVSEGGSGHVLLLEDETSLRDSIRGVLERKGYTVQAYADLAMARRGFSEAAFDLILSDVRLPDGKGTTLVAEALARDASIGVILMSGYASTVDDPDLSTFTDAAFLAKPFSLTDLLREVRVQLVKRS